MIEPTLSNRIDEGARTLAVARPVRRAVIQDFLEGSLREHLGADFSFFGECYALKKMREAGDKAARMDVRDISGAYRELDRCIQSSEVLARVSAITSIPDPIFERAAHCWTPAADGNGGDQRSLAYKILTAALGH